MTFSTGFMTFAFQTVGQGTNDNYILGGKAFPGSEDYWHYHQSESLLKIRKEKTELQKVNSVIKETERKKALAEENKQIAKLNKKKAAALRLAEQEKQYLQEITRLLIVREGIMKRIREEETVLIILMMKRRRLRVA